MLEDGEMAESNSEAVNIATVETSFVRLDTVPFLVEAVTVSLDVASGYLMNEQGVSPSPSATTTCH